VFVGPAAWPRGRYSGVVWPARLGDGYPTMCVSGTELWPGTARVVESQAEWSSGSADLQGGGFGRPAVLILDHGVVKPSTI
jgi:hypothetical protein